MTLLRNLPKDASGVPGGRIYHAASESRFAEQQRILHSTSEEDPESVRLEERETPDT